jgi:hypothetical protein
MPLGPDGDVGIVGLPNSFARDFFRSNLFLEEGCLFFFIFPGVESNHEESILKGSRNNFISVPDYLTDRDVGLRWRFSPSNGRNRLGLRNRDIGPKKVRVLSILFLRDPLLPKSMRLYFPFLDAMSIDFPARRSGDRPHIPRQEISLASQNGKRISQKWNHIVGK